ncbi:MAG: integration host factor subunit beta [Acidobacteria bacterium]|nr:integration host factor subunit beta [Acidobacteriota bacterium]
MVKADIINRVHQKLQDHYGRQVRGEFAEEAPRLPQALVVEAVESLFEALKQAMVRGERIEFRGFGVFQVKPRKRGVGRNPRTGREVKIPPGRTVRFKPGKDLRDLDPQRT